MECRYSMMARSAEALFPLLERLGIGFVAYAPLANGLLSLRYDQTSIFDPRTDCRAFMPQFTPESFIQNQKILDFIRLLAKDYRATPAQICLAWKLGKKPWIVPIPGTRKLDRLKENAAASALKLSKTDVAEIDDMLGTLPMSDVYTDRYQAK